MSNKKTIDWRWGHARRRRLNARTMVPALPLFYKLRVTTSDKCSAPRCGERTYFTSLAGRYAVVVSRSLIAANLARGGCLDCATWTCAIYRVLLFCAKENILLIGIGRGTKGILSDYRKKNKKNNSVESQFEKTAIKPLHILIKKFLKPCKNKTWNISKVANSNLERKDNRCARAARVERLSRYRCIACY